MLEGFGRAYDDAKRREGVLDFEDLQLAARDLLRTHEEIREREHLRFKAIMVDEFQDTNRLQCDLIDLIADGPAAPELFFVGDEFQSIYGFRHADVQVFRERRAAEGGGLALVRNYRSRPEVLAAVNFLFEDEFGDGFQPLAASGEFPDPVFGHPVELLITEKETYAGSGVHWRHAEARHIARRVRALVDEGAAEPGEIVLLFAAGTDAEAYEQELRRAGLPTYRATGRGYFGQQQVVDLLAYLRLLQNRYDDQALLTVLASPFVGVSNDALVLIRRAASKRPLFAGIEKTLPPELDPRDVQLLRAFLQRYERLVGALPRLSLERLCEQIVAAHDYDLAVLAQWDGSRRYANVRKLARLARSYEELRGADIEGFVRFVRDQEAVGAKELEAVAEEEGAGAVRLLTIHGAKGLEFKVVVVADAGRDRPPPGGDEILALADGRFGFKVADPATSKRRGAFDYEDVRAAREAEERAERLRLYYVAMTRAIDRLIVSGAIDRESTADRSTPMGWVLERLDAAEELRAADGAPVELERGDALIQVRFDRFAPERGGGARAERGGGSGPARAVRGGRGAAAAAAGPDAARAAPAPGAAAPPRAPALVHGPVALRDVLVPVLRRAGRGHALARRRHARARRAVRDGDRERRPRRARARRPRRARARGRVGGARPRGAPGRDRRRGRAHRRAARRVLRLRARGARRGPRRCREGARTSRSSTTVCSCTATSTRTTATAPRALVVDYKTNALEGEAPDEIVARSYRLQRLVYALACFRAGADEVEVAYQFLERPDEPVLTTFRRDQVPELEAELSAAIARIRAGEFRPTPSEFACAGCPGARRRLRRTAPTARRGGPRRPLRSHSARRSALRHPRQPARARGGARGHRSPRRHGDRLGRRPRGGAAPVRVPRAAARAGRALRQGERGPLRARPRERDRRLGVRSAERG